MTSINAMLKFKFGAIYFIINISIGNNRVWSQLEVSLDGFSVVACKNELVRYSDILMA